MAKCKLPFIRKKVLTAQGRRHLAWWNLFPQEETKLIYKQLRTTHYSIFLPGGNVQNTLPNEALCYSIDLIRHGPQKLG